MEKCYFEFEINNNDRFSKLQEFFYELKKDKEKDNIISDDSKWISYFEEEVIMKFWWPTSHELKEYETLWKRTPINERFTSPKLQHPWDFESMIDAFANGEYDFVSCERISNGKGRIEFNPWAWPYGGSSSFRALIEYHGFKILSEDI
ncbi:hypothetical protein [Clostridium felsineum]|uniref:Uncharacterized protein n=1 Tax=Clostridium felsineum TaxID=36839 RepID=A0A1S8MEL9_9CLOT|nr:hypothetical protein [Clostridium felsineum]URZ07498.1 hypothetical protein CLROS_028360 [Clostridium felsineum]URZ12529.1 hypothetical protein CROST_032510 [Clostridium felsineum]